MNWWKHAFAVDEPGEAEPRAEQREVIDRLLKEVVRRHLTAPALFLLETCRPLNYLSSQALHFFAPLLTAVSGREGHRHLAAFLERRGSVDHLCRRLEELEAAYEQQASASQAPGEAASADCTGEDAEPTA